MTIALGILASNGVVIAADTEESFGYSKYGQTKISAHVHSGSNGPRAAIVSGAGDGTYIDAFSQIVGGGLLADDANFVKHGPKYVFERAVEEFHEHKIVPFNTMPDSPGVDLVIGFYGEGRRCLFETHLNAVVERPRFASVGSGTSVAHPILTRLVPRLIDVSEAILVATFAVFPRERRRVRVSASKRRFRHSLMGGPVGTLSQRQRKPRLMMQCAASQMCWSRSCSE